MKISAFFPFLMACILSSCSSVSYVQIPVYRAAEKDFPALGGTLLIVNNAIDLPVEEVSHFLYQDGKTQRFRFDCDSLPVKMNEVLANDLYASGLFKDVLIYNRALRSDSVWREKKLLSVAQLDSLRKEVPTDYILSLDALDFQNIIREKRYKQYELTTADMQTIIRPVYRLYNGSAYEPEKHYYFSDTLNWRGMGVDFKHAIAALPPLKSCLEDAVLMATEKGYRLWLPYTENIQRFYVTNSNAAMREAEDYLISGKMEEASYMWEYVYEQDKEDRMKISAAYNLAVYAESQMNYAQAIEWVDRCQKLVTTSGKKAPVNLIEYREGLLKLVAEREKLLKSGVF